MSSPPGTLLSASSGTLAMVSSPIGYVPGYPLVNSAYTPPPISIPTGTPVLLLADLQAGVDVFSTILCNGEIFAVYSTNLKSSDGTW